MSLNLPVTCPVCFSFSLFFKSVLNLLEGKHWNSFSFYFSSVTDYASSKLRYHHLVLSDTKKVQVGKDQEKAQSEKDSHSKNRGGKKPN